MKVSFIGSSGHIFFALEALSLYPNLEFAGACPGEKGESLSNSIVEKYPQGPFYPEPEACIRNSGADIAVVSPKFHRHAQITAQCLEQGIHVYCEKPLALNLDELKWVQTSQQKSGARLALMLNGRYDPAFAAAHKAIAQGDIGEVVQLHSQKSYKNGSKPQWQHHRKTYGGTIAWVGSHGLDWILWMSQGKTFTSVSALDTSIHNHNNGSMESSASVMFELEGGGQASSSIDYLRPSTAPSHGDDRIRVVGSKGIVEVMHGKVQLINEHGIVELPHEDHPQLFKHFCDSIISGEAYSHSHEDIWRLTQMTIYAQEAADQKQKLNIRI